MAQSPSNSITVQDTGGAGSTNRPFTISRVFAQGEIPHYPQARLSGNLLATQADVKTRWSDGSVEHVMISFLASVPQNGRITVDFVDQASGNNANPLTATQMLSSSFNFGAEIDVTNGSTLTANARNMLSAGSFTYWLQGSICTQVIIEDRSPSLQWDLGWDAFKSLHPIFVATFYAGYSGVKVEMILENAWTTKLEDVPYSLALKTGSTLNVTAYTSPTLTHYAKSRWRKTYWSGTTPGSVNIDYNFKYLMYSKAIPVFDQSLNPTPAAITNEAQAWAGSDQGQILHSTPAAGTFYSGEYVTYMPMTGGRGDIGLFPRWYVLYLYSMDPRLYASMVGNGEVSGYVPIHFRESVTGKFYRDPNGTGSATTDTAFGRPVSIDTRPTFSNGKIGNTNPADAITGAGPNVCAPLDGTVPCNNNSSSSPDQWVPDLAHYPEIPYIPYLITGDWYFLEELQFVAAYMLSWEDPDYSVSYARHLNWGILNNIGIQTRGEAWALRNIAHAAFFSPDTSPEKFYFSQKVNYYIAAKEGALGITNGNFFQPNPGGTASNPCPTATYNTATATQWCWGNVTFGQGLTDPLHIPDAGNGQNVENLNTSVVSNGDSPWMMNYQQIVVGHVAELGFPIQAVHNTVAVHLLHQLQDPSYNPYLAESYRIPTKDINQQYFSSWAAVKGGFQSSTANTFQTVNDAEHGYVYIARGAAAFLGGIQDAGLQGVNAFNWIVSTAAATPGSTTNGIPVINENPKWAFVPRSFFQQPAPPTCDLNGDGVVNSLDFTLSIQQALGQAACTQDVDQDGACNVVEVQRIANAAAGQACRIGP
jgi:hypothetical protein